MSRKKSKKEKKELRYDERMQDEERYEYIVNGTGMVIRDLRLHGLLKMLLWMLIDEWLMRAPEYRNSLALKTEYTVRITVV
jgi:hypothetical protein